MLKNTGIFKTLKNEKLQNILRHPNSDSPSGIIQNSPNPPPTDKMLLPLEQKFSYGDIQRYTDICFQSTLKMLFLDIKKGCSANVSLTPSRNMSARKCLKVRNIFGCSARAWYFKCQWVQVCKMTDFLSETVLLQIFFASFCWLWGFLLYNLKLKRSSYDVRWWCLLERLDKYKKVVCPK